MNKNKRQLKVGDTYYAFHINLDGTPCYEGIFYYAGKKQCVREIGMDMEKDNVVPHKFAILMPKDQAESINRGTELINLKTSPLNWRIDNTEVEDVQSPWLPDYTWWQKFIKKYDLEIK